MDGRGEPVVIRLEDALKSEPGTGGRLVWSTHPAPGTGCTVTVRVEEGSAALAGAESAVYARYAICELVALPALLWALTAWMAGVPAAVLWGVVLWRAARCYRTLPSPLRHDPAPDQAEPRVGADRDLDGNSGSEPRAGRGR